MIWVIRVLGVLLSIFFVVPAIYFFFLSDIQSAVGSLSAWGLVVWSWIWFEEHKPKKRVR